MMCSVSRQHHSPTRKNARAAARAPLGVAHEYARRAIAEQRARYEHRRARIVDPQAQTAEIDGKEQHMRPVLCVRHARCAGKTSNPGAAAKAEHRQTLDVGCKFQSIKEHGVEAWNGKPGHSVGDDHVDRGKVDTRGLGRLERHLLQEINRVLVERRRALFPAMWRQIPFDRLAIVTNVDAGIVKKRPESLQMGIQRFDARRGISLTDLERRIGRRQG